MPIDYKKYPPNWKTEIVPAVLKRANHECECCGLPNKSLVWAIKLPVRENGRYTERSIWFRNKQDAERESKSPVTIREVKVVLTIAHLDHDEENHSVAIDRLKALCQLCHLRYDAKEKYRRSLKTWTNNNLNPVRDEP